MAIISSNETTTAADDHAVDLTNGEDAYLLAGVTVAAEGDGAVGIHGPGGNRVKVYGTVISAEAHGIFLTSDSVSPDGSNHVHIGETGIVSAASRGVFMAGGASSLINQGTIVSDGANASDGGNGVYLTNGDNFVQNAVSGTVSSLYTGIEAAGGHNTIINAGEVVSRAGDGIVARGSGGGYVENASTGTVSALYAGIYTNGGKNSILNAGEVTSRGWVGIYTQDGKNSVLNTGEVAGHVAGMAIGIYGTVGSHNRIENHGTISGTDPSGGIGIRINSDPGETTRIINHGSISGVAQSILCWDGDETIINRGVVEGDVWLDGGADLYRGTGGVVLGLVLGGAGDDLLLGGNLEDLLHGGIGRDVLHGRGGEDLLNGGGARDLLKGGAGEDVFDFDLAADSPEGQQRDVILDFQNGRDLIDLQDIDADSTDAGRKGAFTFIGSGPFSKTAGELRSVINTSLGITLVEGDVDGNGRADFQIELAGRIVLSGDDFLM